jgi:hypothetical protein
MENVFLFIGGIFWSVLSGIVIYLFTRSSDHEKRIQRIEDVQGTKIDNLAKDLNDFKKEMGSKIDGLTSMVHKDKNMEGQLNQTLTLLLKELTKNSHD